MAKKQKSAEREAREAEAKELGVPFSARTSDAKLAEAIADAKANPDQNSPQRATETAPEGQQQAGAVQPASADPSGLVVRVVGPRAGRRRAGRKFGPEPVDIPLEELSEDDKAALTHDPELIVTTVETEADGGE